MPFTRRLRHHRTAARGVRRPWRATLIHGSALTAAVVVVFAVLTAHTSAELSDLLVAVAVLWWLLLASTVCRAARDLRRATVRPGPLLTDPVEQGPPVNASTRTDMPGMPYARPQHPPTGRPAAARATANVDRYTAPRGGRDTTA